MDGVIGVKIYCYASHSLLLQATLKPRRLLFHSHLLRNSTLIIIIRISMMTQSRNGRPLEINTHGIAQHPNAINHYRLPAH
jgi:hypothetical protein